MAKISSSSPGFFDPLKPKPPSAREIWSVVRASPRFDEFVKLIEADLETAREQYIAQEASEFNRGRVTALREVYTFLLNGERA